MQQKPVIGIIGCFREFEGEGAHLVKERYVTGVREFADAVPVILPGFAQTEDAVLALSRLDGVLLTGSASNLAPQHYDGPKDAQGPFDPMRDMTTFALISAARELGVPLYGICRGLQEINVALGGSLRDQRSDATREVAHHSRDEAGLEEMFAQAHQVDIAPGSTLAQLLGKRRIEVNSVHYQMVDRLGDGLRVEATAEDGVVEAFAARDGSPLVAVQWHPEWRPTERDHHMKFWTALGDAARSYLARKLAVGLKAG